MSALSGSQLANQHLAKVDDITSFVPSLQATSPDGEGTPIFALRGVSMSDYSLSQDGPVATYFDETYASAFALLGIRMFDLQRVEVLRGPQGTLKAGCHYIDSTGEQAFMRDVRDQFGELFRQAGLLVSPSVAYMYTFAEIAAELALETPGVDALETATLCRGPRSNTSGVTVGSTATIFEGPRLEAQYLWEKALVPHAPDASFNVVSPDFLETVFCLPWGGTSLPLYFEQDARVRSCISCAGFYDNGVMRAVHAFTQKWQAEYKHLPKEQQDAVLKAVIDSTTPTMPPRERTTVQRTVDFAIGRGHLAAVRVTVHGLTPYISTGALHAAAAIKLLDGDTAKVGFASGSKAFGHRYLLGFLEQRGLARASVAQL